MSVVDDRFRAQNLGKYAIRQGGILVHRAFATKIDAEEWANSNYQNPDYWQVEKMERDTQSR